MSDVSVIIVNYNGCHLLGELLGSVARQTRPPDEVIMVDNASVDGSIEYVQQHFPWVKVIPSPTNTGFAEANNIGVASAQGEYIALLNNDTVVDECWLAELVRALDGDEHIGAAVSKSYISASPSIIDSAGAEFNNLGFCWGRGSNQPDEGQFDAAGEVPAATACAMLLRRQALGGASLFDQRFFMYYEELDLTLRLRSRGYSIIYVPTSVVYHKRGESVKAASQSPLLFHQFYCNRNRVKILLKYYPSKMLLRNMPLILLSLLYWDWQFMYKGGLRFFLRAVAAQIRYALDGLMERLHGAGVDCELWLPWMRRHSLREILALRSEFGDYVE